MDADSLRRVAIWAPCLVFAHLYALFFLCSALTTLNPKAWSDLKASIAAFFTCRRRRGGAGKDGRPEGASVAGASEAGSRASAGGAGARLERVPTPVLLSWDGLGCAYNSPEGLKPVLQNVSGEAQPGEMLALMGPSGSGKSTLLDMLAARKSMGRLTGSVRVNGAPRAAGFRRISSYVPQEDNLSPIMDVTETCRLYAALTMPRTPPAQAAARIDEVLAAMGMSQARDRLVGGVLPGGLLLRGLSGGERKRLWVAVGILATPSVVFLDEPTTGLDSCAAIAVVSLLRRTARESGLTVISSIHQPCSAVWAMFDAVTLLAHGLLLYTGPCGEMGPWFEKGLGLGPWNPAVHGIVSDWAMDLVAVEFKKPEDHGRTIEDQNELQAAAAAFARHYRATRGGGHAPQLDGPAANGGAHVSASDDVMGDEVTGGADAELGFAAPATDAGVALAGATATVNGAFKGGAGARNGGLKGMLTGRAAQAGSSTGSSLGALGVEGGSSAGSAGAGHTLAENEQRVPWLTQFRTLLWREMLMTCRNPVDVAGRMLCFAWLAVFTGLVFWNQDNGTSGLLNRVNFLFIHSMFLLLMPFVYMSLYAYDKRTCVADFNARLYSVSAYYAAKQVAVLPFQVANLVASNFIGLALVGMRTDPPALATFAGVSILFYLLAQQVQSLAVIVTPNQEAAFVVSILFSSVNLLMSNYIIRYTDMNLTGLSFLRWVSACNYAFSAFLRNQFADSTVSCAAGVSPALVETLQDLMPNTQLLHTSFVEKQLLSPGPDCVLNLGAVLKYFGVDRPMWVYVIALLVYLLGLHALSFGGLLLLAKKERR